MTIRKYLIRRCTRLIYGVGAFLIVAAMLVTAGPRIFVLRFVVAVLMSAVVAAAFWSLFEIPCPNCWKTLGRVGFRVAHGGMTRNSPVCPHCGISVDKQMPGAV
jgi:hypothetical protein